MSGEIKYKYLDHKIHYFKEPSYDAFDMREIDPLPEEMIEDNDNPINNNIDSTNNLNTNCLIGPGRYDVIIGIAMYAEGMDLTEKTLKGINKNLTELNNAGIPNERILTVIISDGREKVNKEVYKTFIGNSLESREAKIDEYMKTKVFNDTAYQNKKPNYLVSSLIKRIEHKPMANNRSEMDILFSIKKENRGKLDSHYWLFLGFCKKINPKYVVLLDTGTVPDIVDGKALSSLILPMENDPLIAGTCGEMTLNNESNPTNMTLCAQQLEYKYAHAVDKNFESLFGYITVLPGAFSAYRWSALNNSDPLEEYFRTIGNSDADCAMANRYLAEDRIFCWALFAMKGQANILRFIPDALASTDAPEFYGEFMLQRRRWINGSNFAMYYVLGKYPDICNSHHRWRQLFFLLLYIYYVIQAVIGYCILGSFYFVYYMICEKNFGKGTATIGVLMAIYLFIIIFTIIMSLTLKPVRCVTQHQTTGVEEVRFKRRTGFAIVTLLLGLYNLFGFILGIYTVFKGGFNTPEKVNYTTAGELADAYQQYWGALTLGIIGLSNFFLPLLYQPSMICLWVVNFVQYLFFQPTYVIILNIFSICNIDDVSWGNRDSKAHIGDDKYKKFKLGYLFCWLIVNFIVGWGLSFIVTDPESKRVGNDITLINSYSILIAALSGFKLIGALLGKLKYYVYDKWYKGILKKKKFVPEENIAPRTSVRGENGNGIQNEQEVNFTEQKRLRDDANLDVRDFAYNEINDPNNNEVIREGEINVRVEGEHEISRREQNPVQHNEDQPIVGDEPNVAYVREAVDENNGTHYSKNKFPFPT